MRKFTLMGLCMVVAMIFGITSVKAAEGDILVPFVGDATSATISSDRVAVVPSTEIKVGDSVTITPMTCPAESVTLEGTNLIFNKENCTSISTVTWTSSNTSVATVADGKITFVGAGTATITGAATGYEDFKYNITISESSSSETDKKTDTNTNTNTDTNTDTQKVEEDEPDNLVNKNKTVDKEEEDELVIKGTQTKTNPATGIKEVLTIIIPLGLIAGSALFLKRRMA